MSGDNGGSLRVSVIRLHCQGSGCLADMIGDLSRRTIANATMCMPKGDLEALVHGDGRSSAQMWADPNDPEDPATKSLTGYRSDPQQSKKNDNAKKRLLDAMFTSLLQKHREKLNAWCYLCGGSAQVMTAEEGFDQYEKSIIIMGQLVGEFSEIDRHGHANLKITVAEMIRFVMNLAMTEASGIPSKLSLPEQRAEEVQELREQQSVLAALFATVRINVNAGLSMLKSDHYFVMGCLMNNELLRFLDNSDKKSLDEAFSKTGAREKCEGLKIEDLLIAKDKVNDFRGKLKVVQESSVAGDVKFACSPGAMSNMLGERDDFTINQAFAKIVNSDQAFYIILEFVIALQNEMEEIAGARNKKMAAEVRRIHELTKSLEVSVSSLCCYVDLLQIGELTSPKKEVQRRSSDVAGAGADKDHDPETPRGCMRVIG